MTVPLLCCCHSCCCAVVVVIVIVVVSLLLLSSSLSYCHHCCHHRGICSGSALKVPKEILSLRIRQYLYLCFNLICEERRSNRIYHIWHTWKRSLISFGRSDIVPSLSKIPSVTMNCLVSGPQHLRHFFSIVWRTSSGF